MNPFTEEDPNIFEDDNLSDVDLVTDTGESHLKLSKEILSSSHSFPLSGGDCNAVSESSPNDTKLRRGGGNRVSARAMDEVAASLLEGNFFLTALELHTEIVERGKELPRLRDYFSNPANFEPWAAAKPQTSYASTTQRPSFNSLGEYLGDKGGTNLSRTNSYSTLDSLDWSHLSGENEQSSDRIAVLEFELRKANETIHKLRKALTSTSRKQRSGVNNSGRNSHRHDTTNENGDSADKRGTITREKFNDNEVFRDRQSLSGTAIDNEESIYITESGELETGDDSGFQTEDINNAVSHFSNLDSKTLNFVVYEYLQTSGCRLTAISLADELPDQDFEDWDDVGLNTSRPPPLKEIYLKYTTQCTNGKSRSKAANGYAEGTANDSSKGGGIQSANTDHKEIQCNLLSETSNNLNDDAEIKAIVGSETNASHEIDAGGEKTSLLSKSDSAFDPDANRDTDSLAKATSESTGIRNESTDRINVNGETSTEHNASMSDQVNQLEKEIESLKSEVQQMQSQNNLLNNKNVGLENEVIELQANVAKWQQQYGNDLDIKAATISRKNTDNTSERDANDPGIADLVSESVKIDNLDKPEPLLSNRYLVLVKNAIFNSTAGSSSGLTAANLDQEHQSVLDRVNKPEKDLAHVCAKSLPNLVSHVLLQHRIEAIPLIMETVAVHPDQDARMKLLELLFNLVKKPDMRQRHVICQSCLTYARRAGAARVESELLPLCWGQLSEKHVERRILVAETASGLLPYMDRDIACSLVYSILTQLLEDKEQMVVSCALRGLALLLCLMQSEHKFDSYLRLILTHIQSSMETQQTAVRHFLIPCFAYWAIKSTNSEKRKESEGSITEDRENHVERDSELRKEKGKPSDEQLLQSAIFIVVQHMHNLLNETVTSLNQESVTEDNISIESGVSRQSMNQTAFTTAPNGLQSSPDFQTKFNCYCATVEAFMPFLFLQVVLTSPFASKPPPAKELLLSQSEELRIFSRFPQAAISAQDVRSMVSDSSHLAYLVHTFDEYLKETTHPVWPELDWVQTQLLPRLVQILLLLDVNAVPCVNSMSTVCYSLSTVFGRPFTVAKFVPLFKSKFSFDITATEGQDFNNSQFISVLNGSLVPVYAAGVLSTIIDEDTNRATTLNDGSEGEKLKETIGGFLVEMLFIYSVNRAPLLSLRAATIALLSNPSYRPALTESVCSSIINASTQMKLTVCHLLELFTRTVDDLLLTQRVIPALITLSGDADWTIRVATVNCFCSVLALTTTHENTDKVCMQLDSMIDDVSLRAETVRALSRIAHSSVRESIRYDYIFTRVLHIVQQLHTIGNASSDSSSITSIDGPKESSNDSSSRVLVSRLCAHLFNFYSTVCQQCSEYPNEVINASLLPALSKLKLECISFNLNEHVEPLNALIRQLEIQVGIIPVSGSNANSGKAASSSSTVKSEGSNLFSKLKGLAK